MKNRRYSNVPQFLAILAMVPLGLVILLCLVNGNLDYLRSFLGWISSFMRSAGFGGLCALLAARIAWTGVQKQVEVNRSGLSQQGEVERDKSWWSRLEWVAERGLPAPGKQTSLPPAVAINTLHELVKTAADELQSKTVGSMIDEFGSVSEEDRTRDGSIGEEARDRTNQALVDYAKTTERTAAESGVAKGVRYERDVLAAIAQEDIPSSNHAIFDGRRTLYPDALLNIDGSKVVLEIKNYEQYHYDRFRAGMFQTLDVVQSCGADLGILVVPADISDLNRREIETGMIHLMDVTRIVSWTPGQGSEKLIELIRHEMSRTFN